MGEPISDPLLLPIPEPEQMADKIIGQVLWTDHFGNLITNIRQEQLRPFCPLLPLK
jgi:S-adenosylmethionine hydrolase